VIWGLAIVRPADALVVLALVVPFGSATVAWLDAPPVRFTEALALAAISGGFLASLRHKSESPPSEPGAASLLMFGLVVFASLAVVLGAREIGVSSPRLELRNLLLFLTHDYLVGPAPEFAGVSDAALLVEGLALMWLARRYGRLRSAMVLGVLVVSALASVWMSVTQALASDAAAAAGMLSGLLRARVSGPVSDVNAIGSFFAMTACGAFAVAVARQTPKTLSVFAAAAAAALLGGVWLSGSRMALVAAIAGAALVAVLVRMTVGRYRRWTILALAAGAALVLIALTVGLDPRPAASRTAAQSFSRRADFMITGLRMIASAPIFGVGVGRYFEKSGSFMPESIYWFYFHENAHNNFLQIGGELGLLGLGVFLWLLAGAGATVGRALRARPDDAVLAGAAVGTGAFVATWLTSHPLLVPEVAYAFWLAAGATLARADLSAPARRGAASSAVDRTRRSRLLAAAAVVLVASVPLRARAAQPADLDRVAFGFYDWENDNGFPYRWTSRRATFFVPAGARELHLPVRSMMILGHLEPVTFTVAVNGRVLDTFPITQGNWETVRLRLPGSASRSGFTRIDVITDPAWIPAVTGANQDVRVLGVQLGRPEAQ
jgi:O-antigen ligase